MQFVFIVDCLFGCLCLLLVLGCFVRILINFDYLLFCFRWFWVAVGYGLIIWLWLSFDVFVLLLFCCLLLMFVIVWLIAVFGCFVKLVDFVTGIVIHVTISCCLLFDLCFIAGVVGLFCIVCVLGCVWALWLALVGLTAVDVLLGSLLFECWFALYLGLIVCDFNSVVFFLLLLIWCLLGFTCLRCFI